MNYLLDTGILLVYIRKSPVTLEINKLYDPLSSPNTPIISVVNIGEVKSLAIRNGWGKQKLLRLEEFLHQFLIADINVESVIQRYAEIDAFSQGKLPDRPLSVSSRNMGKNDLWIAATASVLQATLLTTDFDFNHLKDEFLMLKTIKTSF